MLAQRAMLGGGVAGKAAAEVAAGLGSDVTILDINTERLHYLNDVMAPNVATLYSSSEAIASLLPQCDIVVGTVLIPGAKAPKLITRGMLKNMKPGSVLVDVSIDQGGCVETSRPTTLDQPTFLRHCVVHYCVPNMTANVPRTASRVLTNAALPYVKALAKLGVSGAIRADSALARGIYMFRGTMVHERLGDHFGIPTTNLNDLLD